MLLAHRGEWRGLIWRSQDGVSAKGEVERTDPEVPRWCRCAGVSGGD